jgi:hypothetical protein
VAAMSGRRTSGPVHRWSSAGPRRPSWPWRRRRTAP